MDNPMDQASNLTSSDVAVIGMACRVPGANSTGQFWENLKAGRESTVFLSDEELQSAGVPLSLRSDPQYVKVAAPLLEGVDGFDAAFFGFTAREAQLLDPQQRIFLEVAWEALESAGYDPHSYRGSAGVYAGVGQSSYLLRLLADEELIESLGGHSGLLGVDKDFLSTYASYKLNLRGPSVTVQTSCSTSLVAVHIACQALLTGECDMALAGGATVHVPQKKGYLYQEGNILSPDGHCRAFDGKAQGTFAGNGVGLVLLKRLEDALADGDPIRAVIKGSAINNDGADKPGFTAPSVHGQRRVIRAAQGAASVSADTITYVEAHGTGTPLGDPIEIAALTEAFRASTSRKGFCAIGSVKTNIGHLDTAAGIIGFIKTVLALEHRQIPPSLHFESANPKIDFHNSPFYVNDRLRDWTANGPLRAGVSSFGIGGTNAHVVVEEAPPGSPSSPSHSSRPVQLLLLSARSEAALEKASQGLAEFLKRQDEVCLADVAYTLQVGRKGFAHRRVVTCRSQEEAVHALDPKQASPLIQNVAPESGREVVFLFPGQGSQSVNMGREIYETEPLFRKVVDECCEELRPLLGFNLQGILYPAADSQKKAEELLTQTAVTQPALFVIEYALAVLWQKWGVRPRAMIGHSLGEYVAACIAGVMSREEALRLVAARGRLMQEMPPGGMLAVAASLSDVEPWLGDGLSIAAINSHDQCIVSGTLAAVEALREKLSAEDIPWRALVTSHAFHSHLMDPILEKFAAELGRVKLKPPTAPFISNLTGTWITEQEARDAGYWVTHLRQPVNFAQGIDLLFKSTRNPLFLEVGPGQTLSRLVLKSPNRANASVLGSLPAALIETLGKLWSMGASIDWNKFHAGEKRRRVPLPTYPFERKRYWIDPQPPRNGSRQDSGVLEKKPNIDDWFYAPLWKQSLPLQPTGDQQALNWLIFSGDDIGPELADRLASLGHNVTRVLAGQNFLRSAHGEYRIDPENPEDYRALFRALQEQNIAPQKIVHLWNASTSAIAPESRIHTNGFYSLLFIAQALETSAELLVVTSNVDMVTGEEEIDPGKATIAGPCLVIPQEYPHLRCRRIDLSIPAGMRQRQEQLEDLFNELLGSSRAEIVAFRGMRRWVRSFEPLPLKNGKASSSLRNKGIYLITGGLGNIGLELSMFLAGSVQARLVLVGRSALPAEESWEEALACGSDDAVCMKIRKLKAIKELGAEILVLAADVGDPDQMQTVFCSARERFGPLNGVFHAAGYLGDESLALMQNMNKAGCEAFFHPKVNGLLVLEKLLGENPPDFCMLFSSISSVLGGLGLCAYSAANLFMDAFANQRHHRDSCAWISVNWDGWTFSTAAAPQGSTLALSMAPHEGIAALKRLLHTAPLPQVIISTGNLDERINQWVRAGLSNIPGVQTEISEEQDHGLLSHDAGEAQVGEMELLVSRILKSLLGIGEIGIHDNFFELGVNSLTAVQMASRLRKELKRTVSLHTIFENPTVARLSAAIDSMIADMQKGVDPASLNEIPQPPLIVGRARRKEMVEL